MPHNQEKLDLDFAYETMTDEDRASVVRYARACAMQRPRPRISSTLRLIRGTRRSPTQVISEQGLCHTQQITLKLAR